MATCISNQLDPTNTFSYLALDSVADTATCPYLVITNADYLTLDSVNTLFHEYFQFDTEIFGILLSAFLVAFVSGHILGRVLSGLRKI